MADPAFAGEEIVGPTSADDDVLRVEHIAKTLRSDHRAARRQPASAQGRGARAAGRQRRRQVDADQDHSGFQSRRRDDVAEGRELRAQERPGSPRSRGRHRVPGPRTDRRAQGPPEHVPGREHLRRPMPFVNTRRMRKETREALDQIGINIPWIDATVARLSGGQRQAIAVARTMSGDADIILLDEPLAAMGAKEGAMILDLIGRLKERGDVSIIMILHNYTHVFAACDRVSLIQDGVISFDRPTAETSIEELNDIVVEEYRRARQAALADEAAEANRPPAD